MTVWRDAQGQAEKLRRRNEWKPVRVLGVDGAYVLGWGEKRPVLVAVDLGEGQPVAVGYVNEHDPAGGAALAGAIGAEAGGECDRDG